MTMKPEQPSESWICDSRPQRFLVFVNTSQLGMNHGPLTKPFGGTSQHHLPPSCLFVGRDTAIIANLEESPLTHIDFGDTNKMTPKPQHQKPILAEHQGNKSRCWILLLRRIHHKDTVLRMVKCHEFKFTRTTDFFLNCTLQGVFFHKVSTPFGRVLDHLLQI